MKVSIILIDWNVRESYHSVEYLNNQTVTRDKYELIWVEYYDKKSKTLEQYLKNGKLDKYIVLGNSDNSHYHKHITWNKGALVSKGEVLVFPDSDAMFKQTFVEEILNFFSNNQDAFLLIDEVRNKNPKFYPFNFPSIEEVLNDSKSENYNKIAKTTNGLTGKNKEMHLPDSFFVRNYGACLCVLKKHFIECGGIDEFEGYRSYICGVYELVFRMKNKGLKECWSEKEFLIHTFHPWMNPKNDKMGPHFRHLSALSLFQYYLKQTLPLKENMEIFKLRTKENANLNKNNYSVVFVVLDNNKDNFFRTYCNLQKATTRDFCVLLPYEIQEKFNNVFFIKDIVKLEDKFRLLKQYGETAVILNQNCFLNENEVDKFFKLNQKFAKFNVFKCFQNGFLWEQVENETINCIFKTNNIENYTDFKNKLEKTKTNSLELFDFNCNCLKKNSIYDNFIDETLNLDFSINSLGKVELLNNAKCLLDKITNQKNFLNYFFLKRCSLMEFYRFIGIFKNRQNETALKGYGFLVENIDFILKTNTKKIPEKFGWITTEIIRDLHYFKGVSCFHMGDIYMKLNEHKKAQPMFEKCLKYITEHKKAKSFLEILENLWKLVFKNF